jgi:UMF1 family MFS transporter
MQPKNNKKTIRAWAFFDWANSAYNLVITSTIFPAYYVAITADPKNGDRVTFFGHQFINTALSNYALAVAYLIMVLLLPILSSIADYRGNKRIFMKFFTWLGALACCALFIFTKDNLEFGIICFALAAIGYSGGFVFYNSYLPEIATLDMQDNVSAKGFTYGYFADHMPGICAVAQNISFNLRRRCTTVVFAGWFMVDRVCPNSFQCIAKRQPQCRAQTQQYYKRRLY